MILGSLTFYYGLQVSLKVTWAFQHLAAGLVLSAVVVEMIPIIMKAPNDIPNTLAILVGFCAGIGILLGLGALPHSHSAHMNVTDEGELSNEDSLEEADVWYTPPQCS